MPNERTFRHLLKFSMSPADIGGYVAVSVVHRQFTALCIRVSVDTLYRDGANDVSRERIQTAPLAHPGRAS